MDVTVMVSTNIYKRTIQLIRFYILYDERKIVFPNLCLYECASFLLTSRNNRYITLYQYMNT